MLIEQVLKAKGREVTTVSADDTLQMAAKVLDEARIGAVVAVDEHNQVVGVLSERDIVRHVAREGANSLDIPVRNAMTRHVLTAGTTERLDTCLERMTDRRVRHLPVLKDGALDGLVSIGDLVKWKIAEAEAEASSLKAYVTSG
ncbi:MAG: CBS domain-containing protein [Pseudomonadota bacterium]